MDQDSCRRAAQAAIEVVREECGGSGVEIREIEDGMFMEIPEEVAAEMEMDEETPVTYERFETVVDDSGFVRSWLAGVVGADADIEVSADNGTYADRVYTFATSVFDSPLDFGADRLVGSKALRLIAEA